MNARTFIQKFLIVAGVGAVASAALGQSSGNIYTPSSWQTVQAQAWSTHQVQPQIQVILHPGRVMPAHQNPSVYPAEAPNTLPLGGTLTSKRSVLGPKFRGIGATGWVPPDPNTAVGPTDIVQVVNSDIAFFNKTTGAKTFQVGLGPVSGPSEGFFESLGVGNFIFDPKCTYDAVSGRYFVVVLELDQGAQLSKLLLAVSDDSNAAGTWFKYRLEAKATIGSNVTWMDYPSIAVNKDAIVVTGNQFGFSSGFGGVQALVIPKAPTLTGGAVTAASIIVNDGFTLQPARSFDGTVDKIYCLSTTGQANQLNLYAVTNLTGTPTIQSKAVTIPSYVFPFGDPPSPGGRFLDNLGNRLMTACYRAGKVYASHTVAVSNSDDRSAARWYEINTNNFPTSDPTFSQGGNVSGGSGEHLFQPAIGTNSVGDIALIFTRSSASVVADVMVTGRKSTDPTGTMGAPSLVESSLGSAYGGQGFNRWGDYFAMEVDPVDLTTFWGTCMIGDQNGNWVATFYKFTISDVLPGQNIQSLDALGAQVYTDPNSVPNSQGSNLEGDIADVRAPDGDEMTVDSVFVERLGQVAAVEFNYVTDGNVANLKYLGARVQAYAPSGTTGMIWMYDWVNNRYVQFKSWAMKATGNTRIDAEIKTNRTRFIGPGGEVKLVIRALRPIRSGRGSSQFPTPFTLGVDQASARVRF